MQIVIPLQSLVIYKKKPALVRHSGEKLEIELENGELIKVRPKDVELLHPGPVNSWKDLKPLSSGDVHTAWELLQGSQSTLSGLAELVFGDFTPATAWAAWSLVDQGEFFRGQLDSIHAVSPGDQARERAARQARQEEDHAWSAFVERLRSGEGCAEGWSDAEQRYVQEITALALAQREGSQVLQRLGQAETPQNAHALLLKLGCWDETVDPYPARQGVSTGDPAFPIPGLPQEPRLDLTHLPAWAIDDEGNQEPDDALSLDGERIWVHIADAAALIPPGSPADLLARQRASSLYLPEGTVPMLPFAAVELLGLGLNDVSPALSFGLTLGPVGEITSLEIKPSWLRVRRLTYEQAESEIEREPFRRLCQVAQVYRQRRERQGAVMIELPEVRVKVDGAKVAIQPVLPFRSREMVRETMLMVGEAAARFAVQQGIILPFVTQEASSPSGQPMDGMAGQVALRRSMKRSVVGTHPGLHAGLGLEPYARLTSPMRRYADLLAHQQVRAALKGEPPLGEAEMVERLGASEAVLPGLNRAEWMAEKHWTLVFLLQNPGWQGAGVIVERRGPWAQVLIPELALETSLYLKDDLPLNARLLLQVKQINLPELETSFRILSPLP